MKKKLLFIIVTVLITAVSAWAILPALAVISPQMIGAALATVMVGGAVTKIAQSPSGTFTVDGSFLKVPIVAYNTVVSAGIESAIGYAASIPWDFKSAWNSGAFSQFPAVQTVAADTFGVTGSTTLPESFASGMNFSSVDGPKILGNRTNYLSLYYGTLAAMSAYATSQGWQALGSSPATVNWWYCPSDASVVSWPGVYAGGGLFYFATWGTLPGVTVPVVVPGTLTDEQASQLAANIAAAQADAAIKDALKDAVAANPGLLTPSAVQGAAIPKEVVDNHVAAEADAAKQREIDKRREAVAADPTNLEKQAALEEALAEQAEARKNDVKDKPETYGPIAAEAFDGPYNPGDFDIPARFNTFVNTVKTSPLFSFSTGFFNSLPGGGSPIYQIEAGRYGHHTIDLSQTLPVGLAVLKTILLACFGFLSIRAVIMKR